MQGQSEIGSFYSPPTQTGGAGQKGQVKHVETVIDIGLREKASYILSPVCAARPLISYPLGLASEM